MSEPSPILPLCTIAELTTRLATLAQNEAGCLAFDGDGTLWSGDVSDDVFFAACEAEWFHPCVRSPLEELATGRGVDATGTLGQLAMRLFDAEKQGRLDERTLFQVMTWCYAGRRTKELHEFAETALTRAQIGERVRLAYLPLLDWARGANHRCWLVTASPLPIVVAAARRLGFDERFIIASRPLLSETGAIAPQMAAPVPYREQKLVQLRAVLGGARLLAAFGDSPFDIDLLEAAELAVGVAPKPALRQSLLTLHHAVELNL